MQYIPWTLSSFLIKDPTRIEVFIQPETVEIILNKNQDLFTEIL